MGVAQEIVGSPQISRSAEEDFFRRFEVESEVSLQGIRGLGPAGQARILVVLEIAKRYHRYRESQRAPLVSPENLPSAVQDKIPKAFRSSVIEKVGFVPMFSSGSIGEFRQLGTGCELGVSFAKQQLLRLLVYSKAEGYWLFHNHPGFDPEVSEVDKQTTRNLRSMSRILGIHLFGHWVVTEQNFIEV